MMSIQRSGGRRIEVQARMFLASVARNWFFGRWLYKQVPKIVHSGKSDFKYVSQCLQGTTMMVLEVS